MSDQREKATLVYIGLRETWSGSTVVFREAYIETTDLERDDETAGKADYSRYWLLFKKSIFRGRPGVVFEIEVTRGDGDRTSVFDTSAKFVEMWTDKAVEWQAIHDTTTIVRQVANKLRKITTSNLPYEILEPFRQAYKKLKSRRSKAAFVALIMAYLEN